MNRAWDRRYPKGRKFIIAWNPQDVRPTVDRRIALDRKARKFNAVSASAVGFTEVVTNTPGLVAFWMFGEDAGRRRLTKEGKPVSNVGVKSKPYDIRLRALIARDVDRLLLAGRCISGDFIAHASYCVTGNAVAMGEAAGATAAVAANKKVAPHEVSWNEAQAIVTKGRRF